MFIVYSRKQCSTIQWFSYFQLPKLLTIGSYPHTGQAAMQVGLHLFSLLFKFWTFPVFCDFSAQALRKMGAFNKKRRHPRAVNNLEAEEELPEKVSLKLVHLHDLVRPFTFTTLTFFLTEICLSPFIGKRGRSLGDCSVLSPTHISLSWKPLDTSFGKPAQMDHCQVLRIKCFLPGFWLSAD